MKQGWVKFGVTQEQQACREWQGFSAAGIELKGYSRSAEKTFFYSRALDLALDAGCCYGHQQKVVLVTHGHSDHTRDLGYLASKEGVIVICPASIAKFVRNTIVAETELGCAQEFAQLREVFRVVGLGHGERFLLEHLKQTMHVVAYQMRHAVPCMGFGLVGVKKKLKEEFVGKTGKELGQLRKDGIVIEDVSDDFKFLYFGDTAIGVIEENPEFFKYSCWIIESTFLRPIPDQLSEEEILARCARDGHIYWPQLEPYVKQHPEIDFVLIHFSLRYSREDIVEFFKDLPYPNVTVLASKYADQ